MLKSYKRVAKRKAGKMEYELLFIRMYPSSYPWLEKYTRFFLPNCFGLGRGSKENTLGPFSVSVRARQDMAVAVDLEKGEMWMGGTRKTGLE